MDSEFYKYCYGSDDNSVVNDSDSSTNASVDRWGNVSTTSHPAANLDRHDTILVEIREYIMLFAIPVLCALGAIGR